MNGDFFSYLQRLELMAFFSAYPLLYAIVIVASDHKRIKNKSRLLSLLPFTYAIVATLYLGLQLKNLYPDYSLTTIRQSINENYFQLWGLLALFFWLPFLHKKPVYSFIHSLVFLFILVYDLIFLSQGNNGIIKNNMKIYTDSLILNAVIFLTLILISFFFHSKKKHSLT